jgi:hypothetical protein
MPERGLGRRPPTDDKHLRRYALTAETMPVLPTPVCIGINWYSGFDAPLQAPNGSWWLPKSPLWGHIRGGHEICIKPPLLVDVLNWSWYYDQGHEGACVGFALSRMMSLLNRQRYDARWLYREAQLVDDWSDTPPEEGTSGRAGCDILRDIGHSRVRGGRSYRPDSAFGISANRWARSVQEIAACLDPASGGARVLNDGYVVLLNSWGTGYPHYVRMDLDSLERIVFGEDGDATVVTDR